MVYELYFEIKNTQGSEPSDFLQADKMQSILVLRWLLFKQIVHKGNCILSILAVLDALFYPKFILRVGGCDL